jgi:adenosylcobinamide-phosphate synthase
VGLDALVGDPRRGHPVAGFGRFAATVERLGYADSRVAGLRYLGVTAGTAVLAAALLHRATRTSPALTVALVAATTWAVLGGSSLAGEARALADELESGDLAAARARIPHLCGRDPDLLDAAGMARAGCESVAENTADAVVGPLLWGAVAGLPGLVGYRAVNTLDAMVGYPSPRHHRFGWAAARCDDLLNLVPARTTAALTVALAPLVGGSADASARAWRRDAAAHPSPNAGPVEAAAAGALGVRLGGLTRYPHGDEQRPVLGDGPPPAAADLRRAARLSRLLGAAATGLAVLLALALSSGPRGGCSGRRPAV